MFGFYVLSKAMKMPQQPSYCVLAVMRIHFRMACDHATDFCGKQNSYLLR